MKLRSHWWRVIRRLRSCTAVCGVISVLLATASAQRKPGADQIFEFHSGFWINLHHFLYSTALATAPAQRARIVSLNTADADEFRKLTSGEKEIWNAAVSHYKQSMIRRDLLFDEGMIEIKNELEDSAASRDLVGVSIPSDMKAVLLKAAPVYRRHFWPRHDSQNREWIAHLEILI